MSKAVLHTIAGGGVAPWPEGAEKEARETLENLLRDYEQILVIGIRRNPQRTGNTEVMYCYQWREGRTCINELIGSVSRLVNTLEREANGDGDE